MRKAPHRQPSFSEYVIVKALKTAAFIVGAAALVATGVGAAIGATGVIAGLGVTGASLTSFGAIASATAGAVSWPAGSVEARI